MTPGLKTSEFKVALLTVIFSVVAYAADWINHRYAWGGGIAAVAAYILSRGFAKTEPRP
jgi:hypothetical protein